MPPKRSSTGSSTTKKGKTSVADAAYPTPSPSPPISSRSRSTSPAAPKKARGAGTTDTSLTFDAPSLPRPPTPISPASSLSNDSTPVFRGMTFEEAMRRAEAQGRTPPMSVQNMWKRQFPSEKELEQEKVEKAKEARKSAPAAIRSSATTTTPNTAESSTSPAHSHSTSTVAPRKRRSTATTGSSSSRLSSAGTAASPISLSPSPEQLVNPGAWENAVNLLPFGVNPTKGEVIMYFDLVHNRKEWEVYDLAYRNEMVEIYLNAKKENAVEWERQRKVKERKEVRERKKAEEERIRREEELRVKDEEKAAAAEKRAEDDKNRVDEEPQKALALMAAALQLKPEPVANQPATPVYPHERPFTKMRREEKNLEELKGQCARVLNEVFSKNLKNTTHFKRIFSDSEAKEIEADLQSFLRRKSDDRDHNKEWLTYPSTHRPGMIRHELQAQLVRSLSVKYTSRRSTDLWPTIKNGGGVEEFLGGWTDLLEWRWTPDARALVVYIKGDKEEERDALALMMEKYQPDTGRAAKASFVKIRHSSHPDYFISIELMKQGMGEAKWKMWEMVRDKEGQHQLKVSQFISLGNMEHYIIHKCRFMRLLMEREARRTDTDDLHIPEESNEIMMNTTAGSAAIVVDKMIQTELKAKK